MLKILVSTMSGRWVYFMLIDAKTTLVILPTLASLRLVSVRRTGECLIARPEDISCLEPTSACFSPRNTRGLHAVQYGQDKDLTAVKETKDSWSMSMPTSSFRLVFQPCLGDDRQCSDERTRYCTYEAPLRPTHFNNAKNSSLVAGKRSISQSRRVYRCPSYDFQTDANTTSLKAEGGTFQRP